MKNKKEDPSGLIFVGVLLLCIGLGFYFNQLVPGTLIGLGLAFITKFIAKQQNFPK